MEDSKKMVYRSTGMNGVTSGASTRTPYSAMDLHTTTSKNPRRTYTPPSTSVQSADVARMKAEDAGLSARGILIRRKLTERKRFDSADYAMKNIKHHPVEEANSTPDSSNKWTGKSQGKVGTSVFLNALKEGEVEMAPSPAYDRGSMGAIASPMAASSTKNRNYGTLSPPNLSGQSVLLQKKLQDKRQFDSADYQLERYQARSGNESSGRSPSPMETSEDEDMNLSSPLASTSCSFTQPYTQMSPSSTVRTTNMNKYAGLSGANEVAMRRIAEKKRFDSADEFMTNRPMTHAERFGQRYNVSVKRPENAYPPAPSIGVVAPPPVPMQAESAAPGSKYGKLCAANVLIRKKLKERKRFDSADYNMDRANHTAMTGNEHEHDQTIETSIGCNPPTSRWASIASSQPNTYPRSDENKQTVGQDMTASSQESRLMARNVMLHKKLAERKRFDSADFFSAKDAAKRGHLAA